MIAPGSFVSAETALSYHGWIPESVRITISISPGVKSKHVHSAIGGDYEFRPLSVCQGGFLELVQRQAFNAQVALVAKPARALMDMVYLNKIAWQGLDWLTESLRIEGNCQFGETFVCDGTFYSNGLILYCIYISIVTYLLE